MRRIAAIVTTQPTFKFNNTTLICIPKLYEDHVKITKMIADSKVEYFTHNPLITRPVKLVVKYVPLDIPEADIKADLQAKELPYLKLSRVMMTRDGRRTASNILLLTINKELVSKYYNVTEICDLKVNISPYNSPVLSQCHNCQGFAHSSEMCGRKPKCVRCGQSHRGEPCRAESCKCANCLGDHPANYRGCPAYQAALTRYNTANKKQPPADKPAQSAAAALDPAQFPPLPTTTSQPPSQPPQPSSQNPWQPA